MLTSPNAGGPDPWSGSASALSRASASTAANAPTSTAASTSANTATIARDARPAYRPFDVSVSQVRTIGPHFRRVTFRGEGLEWFSTHGHDQRIKLLFPLDDGYLTDVGARDPEVILGGTWYERWRAAPPSKRSPLRTYTVRAARPDQREVDVDMVVHGDGGPASRWVAQAEPGQRLVLIGPDARSHDYASGADWAPGGATELLLAGDETAAPAICSILESLPPRRRAQAFIEAPDAGDVLDVAVPPSARITWLPRGEHPHGHELLPAVRSWARANESVLNRARAVVHQDLEDRSEERRVGTEGRARRVRKDGKQKEKRPQTGEEEEDQQ